VEVGTGDCVKLPTVAPKLSETPGSLSWIGPAVGAHNAEIYGDWLGYPAAELERLVEEGVI